MAYQPIQVSFPTTPTGLAGGIGDGIDAFMRARQQSIANEQARADALLKRQQFDETQLRNSQIDARANRQIATEEENNRRKNATEDRQASGERAKAFKDIGALVRANRPIEAAALAQQWGYSPENLDEFLQPDGPRAPGANPAGPPPGMPPQTGGPGPTPAQFGPPRPPQFGPPPAPPPGPQLPSGPPPSQAAGLAPPPMQQDATGLPTGPGQAPQGPQGFDQWYAGEAQKLGINPNPDDPRHHYDYRAFYKAMLAGQVPPPEQTEGHFSSQFKTDGNEREMLKDRQGRVFNTRTGAYADGAPVSEEELRAATTAPTLSPQEAQGPPPGETPEQTNQRRARILRLRGKDGQVVPLDIDEDERATAAARQRFLGEARNTLDLAAKRGIKVPFVDEAMVGVEGGMLKPDKAWDWIQKRIDSENDKYAALNRPRGGPDWREMQGGGRLLLSQEVAARQEASRIMNAMGYHDVYRADRQWQNMLENLSHGGGALDAITAGSFVKQAQGGTGVLSDQDMKFFWDKMGGLGLQTVDQVNKIINGTISDPKRALVMDAVQASIENAAKNMNQMKARLASAMRTSPNFSPFTDSVVGSYFEPLDDSSAGPSSSEPPRVDPMAPIRAGSGRGGGRTAAPVAPGAVPPEVKARIKAMAKKKEEQDAAAAKK